MLDIKEGNKDIQDGRRETEDKTTSRNFQQANSKYQSNE